MTRTSSLDERPQTALVIMKTALVATPDENYAVRFALLVVTVDA
jgi:hypothetical protein